MLMLPTHGMMNFSTDKTLCVRPYIVNIELDDQILIMDDQKKQCEIQIAETFADSESFNLNSNTLYLTTKSCLIRFTNTNWGLN